MSSIAAAISEHAAVAVWRRRLRGRTVVEAAFARPGGRFGKARRISAPSDAGLPAGSPAVTFTSTGRAIAVWTRFAGHRARVEAAVGRPARGFGKATTLAVAPGDFVPGGAGAINYFGEPRVTAGPSGRAVAWWRLGPPVRPQSKVPPTGRLQGRLFRP